MHLIREAHVIETMGSKDWDNAVAIVMATCGTVNELDVCRRVAEYGICVGYVVHPGIVPLINVVTGSIHPVNQSWDEMLEEGVESMRRYFEFDTFDIEFFTDFAELTISFGKSRVHSRFYAEEASGIGNVTEYLIDLARTLRYEKNGEDASY
jgi:hypothetical protein